jgi:NTP pyrophosphatase (non-canonical NTP hydrolase)
MTKQCLLLVEFKICFIYNQKVNQGRSYNVDIKDMQKEVDGWISQFEEGYWHPLSMLARLTEEVGELAREVNHRYGQKPKKPEEQPGDLASELADILFIIICYANSLNIDIEEAFINMMNKYRQRDKNRWTPIKKN